MNIGIFEIGLIVLVALFVFGPEDFPKLMAKVGKGVKDLKKASQEIKDDLTDFVDDKSTSKHESVSPSSDVKDTQD